MLYRESCLVTVVLIRNSKIDAVKLLASNIVVFSGLLHICNLCLHGICVLYVAIHWSILKTTMLIITYCSCRDAMEHSHKHTISRVLSLYHCSDAVTSPNTTKENSYITNLLIPYLYIYTFSTSLHSSFSLTANWCILVMLLLLYSIEPPGEPTDIIVRREGTTVFLSWKAPSNTGGRTDIFYTLWYQPQGGERMVGNRVNGTMGLITGIKNRVQ